MGPVELPLEQAMAGSSRREELKEETREHKGKRTTGQEGKNRADAGTRGHLQTGRNYIVHLKTFSYVGNIGNGLNSSYQVVY